MSTPEELMNKLAMQDEKLKTNYGASASMDGVELLSPSSTPTTGSISATVTKREVTEDYYKPTSTLTGTQDDPSLLRNKIRALEEQMGQGSSVGSSSNGTKAYLDDMGNETWYVKNISNGHVAVSDMDNTLIRRNTSVDLLTMADVEHIRKSRDIRVALYGNGGAQLLKRLTPEEYYNEKVRENANTAVIDQLKSANVEQTEILDGIRPMVKARLEKYNLSLKKETAHQGMPGPEFVEWALSERLTRTELDFITGSIIDTNVRTPLLRKIAELSPIM